MRLRNCGPVATQDAAQTVPTHLQYICLRLFSSRGRSDVLRFFQNVARIKHKPAALSAQSKKQVSPDIECAASGHRYATFSPALHGIALRVHNSLSSFQSAPHPAR